VLDHGAGRRARGWRISRYHHDEAGQRAGECDILDPHLGRAVFANRDSGMAADQLHVEVRVGHAHPDLVERVAKEECREACRDRDLAARGQARGHANHIRLRDADIEKPVGELLREPFGAGRVADIAINDHDARVFPSQIAERFAKGVAGRLSHL
jgi:hypothetical protein